LPTQETRQVRKEEKKRSQLSKGEGYQIKGAEPPQKHYGPDRSGKEILTPPEQTALKTAINQAHQSKKQKIEGLGEKKMVDIEGGRSRYWRAVGGKSRARSSSTVNPGWGDKAVIEKNAGVIRGDVIFRLKSTRQVRKGVP